MDLFMNFKIDLDVFLLFYNERLEYTSLVYAVLMHAYTRGQKSFFNYK